MKLPFFDDLFCSEFLRTPQQQSSDLKKPRLDFFPPSLELEELLVDLTIAAGNTQVRNRYEKAYTLILESLKLENFKHEMSSFMLSQKSQVLYRKREPNGIVLHDTFSGT